MAKFRILITKEYDIEYEQDQETGCEIQKKIEKGDPIIMNVDNDEDAERLLADGAWEMPEEDVQRIFGDKACYAYNGNCTITGDKETGYQVTFKMEEEDIEVLKTAKKQEAVQALEAAIANITPFYPTDEKVSFAKQEEEANKFLANEDIDEKEIPCITAIAKGRQIPVKDLATKIKAKSTQFSVASGIYLGRKQHIEDLVNEATTADDINSINVVEIMSAPLQ